MSFLRLRHMDMDMSAPTPTMSAAAAYSSHAHSLNETLLLGNMTSNETNHFFDPTYFQLSDHAAFIYLHIVLAIIAWFFILPLAVMLSISRSRLAVLSQIAFAIVNGVSLLFATIYNASTPDLYENNVHHPFGWALTWILAAQFFLGLIRWYTLANDSETKNDFHGGSTHSERLALYKRVDQYRWSRDSGHGTDVSSPRGSIPVSPSEDVEEDEHLAFDRVPIEEKEYEDEKYGLIKNSAVDRFASKVANKIAGSRLVQLNNWLCCTIDRLALPLGFFAFTTGVVTYGGFFKGSNILSGLAHFIKGGIFLWYGMLVLGRYLGSFADIGWAWNLRPTAEMVGVRASNAWTAEMSESALIAFYGITNVFLEHLGGGEWSAQDLEHISITVLFFGGGVFGMLLESQWVRKVLKNALSTDLHTPADEDTMTSEAEPRKPSLNPVPAIIISLLGVLMSSHHQASMVSTMLHSQWGTMFKIGSIARICTYVICYLRPPTSFFPSRPPTEIVVAFCLIAGGAVFMCSNKDFVDSLEYREIGAMVVYTLLLGLTALLMAWEVTVLGIKAWAVNRRARRS